jgi:hypothetical protein
MPIVYVIQESQGKNISQATKFGEIKVLFPPDFNAGFSAGQAASKLMLLLSNYKKEDYLLLIGDPVLIGIATAVASHWANGKVQLLKWDRQENMYYSVKFNLFHERGERDADKKESFE